MKFIKYILFLILICFSQSTLAQVNFEKLLLRIDSTLLKQSENFPEEYIITVTDKNEYLAGETIWASFFLNNGTEASYISKTVYAELVGNNGKILVKKMLPVENGFANADISIPGSTPSGSYVLNVYSNWMKNFPTKVTQQNIFITGSDYTAKPFQYLLNDEAATAIIVQPEGGSFIPDVQANFTIQMLGKNKLPVSDTFTITEDGKIIAAGRSILGLASVNLVFSMTKNYMIQSGGFLQKITFNTFTGVHLQANTTGKSKFFISIDKSTGNSSDKFLLIGLRHHTICYQSEFSFSDGATTAAITRAKLPAGVIDFYLFDETENIVAYRRVYNNSSPSNLIMDKLSDNKNQVSYSSSIVNGTVTVTAVNTSAISTLPSDHFNLIQTEKHLQHEQAYQFIYPASESSLTEIDQLLSIQSTSMLDKKFNLSNISLKFMAESGITVKGKVAPYAGSGIDKGYHVEMFVRGEDSTRIVSRANALSNGEFSVMDLAYKKQATLFFQGHNPKNNNELLKVELYPSYFDTLKTSSFLPAINFRKEFINKAVSPLLAKKIDSLQFLDSQYKVLQEVVVKGKRKSKTDSLRQDYLSAIFDDGNAQTIIPDGLHYASIWHYLRNSVPGLNIVGDLINPDEVNFNRYVLTPRVNNTGEDVEMDNPDGIYFFLNEIQVQLSVISSLNLEDISLITVSKQPAPAMGAYNGYISIYTKKGISNTTGLQKNFSSVKREGYSIVRNSFIAEDWRPISTSTIVMKIIDKTSKPILLKLSPGQVYKIIIAGRDEKGNFILEEKFVQ